jgi:transcriptional regulator with XRE-family HTH domain
LAKKSINEKLLILSKMKGQSQSDIAKDVGMQPSHINRYFNGANDITSSHFVDILKALGIDLEEIILKEFEKLTGDENGTIEDFSTSVKYLLDSLDEIGRQTALSNLLWMAQTYMKAKGTNFPKKIETQIKRELSLI